MIEADDFDSNKKPVLFILIKILCILAIVSLISFKLHSIPHTQSKLTIDATKYRYSPDIIDNKEMENALLAITTTFVFIMHVIGLIAVIREHYWLLFTYSTYLSANVLFNILTVINDPPQIFSVISSLATGLLTFTLGLMARNRSLIPFDHIHL